MSQLAASRGKNSKLLIWGSVLLKRAVPLGLDTIPWSLSKPLHYEGGFHPDTNVLIKKLVCLSFCFCGNHPPAVALLAC